MCINIPTHAYRYICNIRKLIYAFYEQFPSTLKIISAACNILSELYQASKHDSVTNSTRRNVQNTTSNIHDFTKPQNKHHDKLEEFRLYFWKGKKKVFLRSESKNEISYLCKSFICKKQIKNIASDNL